MSWSFANAAGTMIRQENIFIPVDLANADYAALVASGTVIGAFSAPEMTDAPPQRVTDLQFVMAAEKRGWITKPEAEAWLAERSLPALVSDAIALLPDAEQFEARIRARSMGTVRIGDPILTLIMPLVGATEADRDNLFRLAATL